MGRVRHYFCLIAPAALVGVALWLSEPARLLALAGTLDPWLLAGAFFSAAAAYLLRTEAWRCAFQDAPDPRSSHLAGSVASVASCATEHLAAPSRFAVLQLRLGSRAPGLLELAFAELALVIGQALCFIPVVLFAALRHGVSPWIILASVAAIGWLALALPRLAARLPQRFRDLPRPSPRLLALCAASLIFQGLRYLLTLKAYGLDGSVIDTFLILALAGVAGLLPLGPGSFSAAALLVLGTGASQSADLALLGVVFSLGGALLYLGLALVLPRLALARRLRPRLAFSS